MISDQSFSHSNSHQSKSILFARLAWIAITILTLVLLIAGIPRRFENLVRTADQRSLLSLGVAPETYAVFIIVLNITVLLVHILIAAIIFWRRKNDWMAWLVALALVTNGAIFPLSVAYMPGVDVSFTVFLVKFVIYLGLVSGVTLLYLFPDGRFVPNITFLLAILWAVLCIPAIFFPVDTFNVLSWPFLLQIIALLLWSGTGVIAQFYRYWNVSSPLQRQQSKWALFGLTAAAFGPLAYFLPFFIIPSIAEPSVPNLLYQRIGTSLFTISFLVRTGGAASLNLLTMAFPISFAIAILRYRLWDIDILINRALVYTALSGTLILIYFSSVVLLEGVLRALTGEGRNEIVTVVSTLGIAALFTPLRRRIQDSIDRRFYRRKYDAEKTMVAFSTSLRNEVNLNQLTERVITTVEETMQPEHVSLWLTKVRRRQ